MKADDGWELYDETETSILMYKNTGKSMGFMVILMIFMGKIDGYLGECRLITPITMVEWENLWV